mgnify:FL=1
MYTFSEGSFVADEVGRAVAAAVALAVAVGVAAAGSSLSEHAAKQKQSATSAIRHKKNFFINFTSN